MMIRSSSEFEEWLARLDRYAQWQVEERLDRIREHAHFGDVKFLGDRLWELRWRKGRRIYYAVIVGKDGKEALMLLGGDKNGQERDIAHARRILERDGGPAQAGSQGIRP